VAALEFQVIRLHTRYRRELTEERTREKRRVEKLLESAAIKLSGVLTDIHGVPGRDITGHLIAGERDPRVLARLARTRAKAKIPRLEQALDGTEFLTARHALLLKAMLRRIDAAGADIAQVSRVTGELLAPWEEQLRQVEPMPGWQRRAARAIIAESGSLGASPRQGPLRTVHARCPGTRLRQAPGALRVLASCVCGL
jgi:transposase